MSKFRARQLDATKPIAIYFQEDISDSTEFNNVTNRTVPQLPTGMEKEEETVRPKYIGFFIFHSGGARFGRHLGCGGGKFKICTIVKIFFFSLFVLAFDLEVLIIVK